MAQQVTEQPVALAWGNAAPWTLSSFAIGAVGGGLVLAEIFPAHEQTLFILGPLWLTAGIVQLLGSIYFYPARATFAAWAFGIFGFFWLSAGVLIIMLDNGVVLKGILASEDPIPLLGDALAAFAVAWNCWFFLLLLTTLRAPLVWFTNCISLVTGTSFLIAGWWSATAADGLQNIWVQIGGAFVMIVGVHGFYIAFNEYWQSVGGKALPLGPSVASLLRVKF